MLGQLNILCYNVGKRKQVQQSLMNDAGLADFDLLAVVEPHIFGDINTGWPRPGHYTNWQSILPSTYRQDGHIRHSCRAMLWVNTKHKAVPVPVNSYDVAAAIILHNSGPILAIAAYDPNDTTNHETPPAEALAQKLQLLHATVATAKEHYGQGLGVLMYTDFNRHHALWGGPSVNDRQRAHEADDMLDMIYDLQLHSLLRPGTTTWEHQTQGLSSTVDVLLASTNLAEAKLWCQIHETDHGSDHKPIEAAFTLGLDETPVNARGRLLLKDADWNRINIQLKASLRPCRIGADLSQLNEDAEHLVKTVTDTLHQLAPRAKPSPYAKRWWTKDLTLLRQSLTAARNAVTTANAGEMTHQSFRAGSGGQERSTSMR